MRTKIALRLWLMSLITFHFYNGFGISLEAGSLAQKILVPAYDPNYNRNLRAFYREKYPEIYSQLLSAPCGMGCKWLSLGVKP